MGKLTCDLQDKTQLFREVKNTLLQHLFHKEWTANQNLTQAYNGLQEKFDSLQKEKENADNKIQKLEQQIEEMQKSIDNQHN